MDLQSEKGREIKKDYWLMALALANWLAVCLLIPRLPDIVPMHFNLTGEVDRWGSKWNYIWLGAMAPAIWALMTWLPAIDPKKENYKKFPGSYRLIRAVIVLTMSIIMWLAIMSSMETKINLPLMIKLLIGILLVVLGNVMTRLRPNWFTGIKTPWTLADPVVWKKTHRIGGFVMTGGGLLFILGAVFWHGPAGIWIPFWVTLGGSMLSVVYSAYLWKKLHPGESVSDSKEEKGTDP